MSKIKAFAAHDVAAPLKPFELERREVQENDVYIDIEYCGVCHSDLHFVKNDWGMSEYPLVPGHEIIGRVLKVGKNVTNFKEGELVGVGCMVDSCRHCNACEEGLEQYCEKGSTFTYNGPDKYMGGMTFGGYSQKIVVDKDFVLHVPENLDAKAAAPLLCAGITTYSPLKYWNVKKGDKVGIIGLGGLGHMGVKFANAMGAEVVVITSSPSKSEAARKLGAHHILISKDKAHMARHANSFDFLLDTIPVGHDLNPYLGLLRRDATLVIVGAVEPVEPVHGGQLIFQRKRLAGSLIGGIKETQEMLDFCGEHNIVCDVELIKMQDINTAYERMLKSDVKYRFVIDIKSLEKE